MQREAELAGVTLDVLKNVLSVCGFVLPMVVGTLLGLQFFQTGGGSFLLRLGGRRGLLLCRIVFSDHSS